MPKKLAAPLRPPRLSRYAVEARRADRQVGTIALMGHPGSALAGATFFGGMNRKTMQDYLEVSRRAALAGGQILLDLLGRIAPREKAPRDLVTEADLASQRAIQRLVLEAFPHHRFLGEEDGPFARSAVEEGSPCWVVDPLDGTTNFVHQLPNFAVSVALVEAGAPVVGTVYDPSLKECYTASAGGGAFLNGKPLRVSDCRQLNHALVAVSFSADVREDSEEVRRFLRVLGHCQALRRMGSSALNLAYLSAGRLDAYWATSVKAWDVAAGILLVREAGGLVTGIDGEPFQLAEPRFAAGATAEVHGALLQLLALAR